MPVPGPFTLAGRIDGGEVYPDRNAVTEALIPIVSAELKALVAAGVDFVQLDEPSFSCHPDAADHFLVVVARTVRGVHATAAWLRKTASNLGVEALADTAVASMAMS